MLKLECQRVNNPSKGKKVAKILQNLNAHLVCLIMTRVSKNIVRKYEDCLVIDGSGLTVISI